MNTQRSHVHLAHGQVQEPTPLNAVPPQSQPLIDANGQPRWGVLQPLPSVINWRDYDWRTPMGRRRSSWLKRFGFKHFDFYGVQTPELVFGSGLVRLGWMVYSFSYVFDKASRVLDEWSIKRPLDTGLRLQAQPIGDTRLDAGALNWHSSRETSNFALNLSIHKVADASVRIYPKLDQVLGLTTPIANTGFVYAQKTAGVAVQGEVHWRGKTYRIDPKTAGCYHDWTAGYLRRETHWNWACATGVNQEGQPVCVNLACGVNETSYSENGVWVNGEFLPLGLAHFEFDRVNVLKPWRIRTHDGRADIAFSPLGEKQEKLNMGFAASNFHQVFGRFSGWVQLRSGRKVHLEGLDGWCEDHYAKW